MRHHHHVGETVTFHSHEELSGRHDLTVDWDQRWTNDDRARSERVNVNQTEECRGPTCPFRAHDAQ